MAEDKAGSQPSGEKSGEQPRSGDAASKDQEQEQSKDSKDKDQSKQQPRRVNWRLIIIAAVVVLVIALLVLTWYLIFKRGRISTDDAYTDGRAIDIAAKVTGYVQRLAIRDNQFVHAGDLLLVIDPRDYLNARDSAAAQVAQLQAQLHVGELNLQVERTARPAQLASALAAVQAARAAYAKAQADLARQRQVDPRATTRTMMDQAREQALAQAAQLQQALAQLRTARLEPQDIAVSQAQVEALQAQVRAAEVQLRQAQLNLSYTEVRAPQDGRVTQRNVEQGSFVQPNQDLLYIVTPEVWITANYKEGELADLRAGQPVAVAVDAFPQLQLHGHVDSVQMGSGSRFSAFPAENATGNFVKIVQRVPVKIVIDSGLPRNWSLPLGLSVEPTVDIR